MLLNFVVEYDLPFGTYVDFRGSIYISHVAAAYFLQISYMNAFIFVENTAWV